MVRTIRLTKDLERSIRELSRHTGLSASEVIRDAIRLRAAQVNGLAAEHPWAPYVGKVAGHGRVRARNSGKEFGRALAQRRRGKSSRA